VAKADAVLDTTASMSSIASLGYNTLRGEADIINLRMPGLHYRPSALLTVG